MYTIAAFDLRHLSSQLFFCKIFHLFIRAVFEVFSPSLLLFLQAFFKRHEKLMNSVKRKQKDAKNREIFEKCFPEIKKIREDQKEKDGSSGKGDDGHGASSFFV